MPYNPRLNSIAKLLGGEINGGHILAPGPNHTARDRSLRVFVDSKAPNGFGVYSFSGDAPIVCRDYVCQRLGLPAWRPGGLRTTNPSRPPETPARIPPPSNSVDVSRAAHAIAIWHEAEPIAGTIGESYLIGRIGYPIPPCSDVRFHRSCPRRDGRHPALVALLRDAKTNEPRAIQRTFLLPDGSDRLRDTKGKMALGQARGAVVKLTSNEQVTNGIGIAEGLEKSLAILAAGWTPIWCTCGTATMASFPTLNGIETLTIFADRDEAGQKAATMCAERWAEAGHEAFIRTPNNPRSDWDDLKRGGA